MGTEQKIRLVASEIIRAYVHHVKNKIGSLDAEYVKAGVDADIDIYEALFNIVINKRFGKKGSSKGYFSEVVIEDCVGAIDALIKEKNYTIMVKKYSEPIYKTCKLIFRKVVQGVLESERM